MSVTILDGGMGGEISARVEGSGHGLWSAKALLAAPEVVVAIHREYIDAGARIIITNTYSTVPHYLCKEGIEDRYVELTRLGGELARRAVEESGEAVLVAGSLPPLNESYRADLVPPSSEALPIYQNLVEALNPYVDVYVCETMSSADEALNAATQAVSFGAGKPVYVSWTLNETPGAGLRSGETVAQAFAKVAHLNLAGYLFNCTSPESVLAALPELRDLTDKPIGCYANRLNEVDAEWTLDNEINTGRREDLSTEVFVRMCQRFADAGATLIGGCCGIGPTDIAALSTALGSNRDA
jgi:S-methylmethionine-dependent homocysteine/selenocysteine methylase